MLKKITLITTGAISAFAMHTAELNINDTDLEAGVRFDIGQFNQQVEPNTIFLGGKFLKIDDKEKKRVHTAYYETNFLMQQAYPKSGISVGLGMKVNYTSNNASDYVTIPLGAEIGWKIPIRNFLPMHLHTAFYYAPEVLSFDDAKNFIEYRVNYDIEVIRNANVTVGYRHLNTNYVPGDYSYNEAWYVGFKFSF